MELLIRHISHYRIFRDLIILMLLVACDDVSKMIDLKDAGQKYFPLDDGIYREYEVEDIHHDITGSTDTLRYLLKEEVMDTFVNQSGDVTYLLKRYSKNHDSADWVLDSVWTAFMTSTRVVVTENNVPFVKLAFPATPDQRWNGNAFNVLEEEIYSYEFVNEPYSINGIFFGNTAKVVHKSEDDIIVKTEIRNEIYAENVGLIYKESIILHYCTDVGCLGDTIIERGRQYRLELIGYGKD